MLPDDQILEMAKQADQLAEQKETEKYWIFAFARLIEAKTREECAALLDESATPRNDQYLSSYILKDCAVAIREMK